MNPLKGACIIGQSGGPTAVINASALGAIQSALQSEQVTRVLGAANGIEGVLKERLFDMARRIGIAQIYPGLGPGFLPLQDGSPIRG